MRWQPFSVDTYRTLTLTLTTPSHTHTRSPDPHYTPTPTPTLTSHLSPITQAAALYGRQRSGTSGARTPSPATWRTPLHTLRSSAALGGLQAQARLPPPCVTAGRRRHGTHAWHVLARSSSSHAAPPSTGTSRKSEVAAAADDSSGECPLRADIRVWAPYM